MQKMSKEEFIEILSRQQRSGLTIKDFCINEAYTESSFYYWKGKFGLSRRYHMDRHSSSLEEFAPVSLTSSPASHSACDSGAIQTGEIRIEFPGGIIAHFSGMAESQAAMQRTTMKLLHAEDGGLVLYIKRLEEGTFRLPSYDKESKSYPMQWRDLVLMVEGINDEPSKRLKRLKALRKSDMQY